MSILAYMDNNVLVNTYPITITSIPVDATSQLTQDVISNFNITVFKAQNNNPLCAYTNNCNTLDSLGGTSGDVNSPTYATNFKDTLASMLNDVTFETLYKNLASIPNVIDRTNRKLINTVYNIDSTKSITTLVDRTIRNMIVITITGSTGFTKSLVKTILLDGKKTINISYSFGV